MAGFINSASGETPGGFAEQPAGDAASATGTFWDPMPHLSNSLGHTQFTTSTEPCPSPPSGKSRRWMFFISSNTVHSVTSN